MSQRRTTAGSSTESIILPPPAAGNPDSATWQRIRHAAERYDVEVSESSWRDLAKGGKYRAR